MCWHYTNLVVWLLISLISCFIIWISLLLCANTGAFAGFKPVGPPGAVTIYPTLYSISSNTPDTKSNILSKTSSNWSPSTAGSIGSSLLYCNPKNILGELITNLLFVSSGLVSKWKLPFVLKPIALSENNSILSSLALKTNLSEFINTWLPWYVLGDCVWCFVGKNYWYVAYNTTQRD